MTLASACTPRVVLTGNGTRGPYSLVDASSVAIRLVSTGHLRLTRYSSTTDETGTVLALTTDYTVGGTQDARTFTLTSAQDVLTSSQRIVAERVQAYTQDLDLTTGGAFNATSLESRFDKLAEFQQELKARLDRAIVASALDTTPSTFPLKVSATSGDLLAFDTDKNLTPVTPSDIGITSVNLGTGWGTVLALPAAGTIDNLSGVRFVATYAELTALVTATGLSDNSVYCTYGRAAEEDGGFGFWRYDSGSTATANGGTILAIDGSGAGRFFRLFGGPASILWWGVDQTAFTAAEASGLTVEVSPYSGTYTFATDVTSRFVGFGGTKRDGAGTAATGSAKAKNLAYGPFAMNRDATGTKNVAIGGSVLEANTTGEHNTAVGDESMRANTTGRQNTAVGLNTLMANTTGGNNVAIGTSALLANTTGSENTAVGRAALISATTASWNTMVGRNAGWKITTGEKNVGVGGEAMGSTGTVNPLTAYESVAVGYRTQYTVETGYYNTSVGCEALYFNVSGANNTAIGWRSLFYYTGSDATAVGYGALNALTTGLRNTALGSSAGGLATTGADNTALGYSAGYGLTTGADNTIVGSQAQVGPASANNVVIGSSAGKSTLGSDNVIVGQGAGTTLTGGGNTLLGRDAEPSSAAVNNEVALYSGGTMRLRYTTAGGWYLAGGLQCVPAASVTPAANGDLAIEATNNTTLTFKYKGSDGTVRSGTVTLS